MSKLQELFPSANVTKMVSRTPGIMYLDIDRTVRPKAMWIQKVVGVDQEGLDRLVEQGERTCDVMSCHVMSCTCVCDSRG